MEYCTLFSGVKIEYIQLLFFKNKLKGNLTSSVKTLQYI